MRSVLIGLMAAVMLAAAARPVAAQDLKAKGEKLFADNKCALCHSVAGKGNVKNPLDGIGAKMKAEEIRLWLVDPRTAELKLPEKPKLAMKSFKTLPPADIDALVAYVQSLK